MRSAYTGSRCSKAPLTSSPTPPPPPPTKSPTPLHAPTVDCTKTGVLGKACPSKPGMMLPAACSATCSKTFSPWWSTCKSSSFIKTLPGSTKRHPAAPRSRLFTHATLCMISLTVIRRIRMRRGQNNLAFSVLSQQKSMRNSRNSHTCAMVSTLSWNAPPARMYGAHCLSRPRCKRTCATCGLNPAATTVAHSCNRVY